MKGSLLLLVTWPALLAVSGCAAYRPCPYHVEKAIGSCPDPGKGPLDRQPDYTIGFVEFDDQGWLWDRGQMETVLSAVEQTAQKGGAVIVVYVHGWHHSADDEDGDVAEFRRALSDLDKVLNDDPELSSLRAAAIKGKETHGRATVFGVYAGWRGGSLPGNLDFLTFSERKRAAHRVGHGDLSELLIRLNNIHATANTQRLYAGMVVVGHSFGGAAVFSAISDRLQIDLTMAGAGTAKAGAPRQELCRENPAHCLNIVGDLVVLVNPAFESSLYNEIDYLAKSSSFDPCQTPVLLAVSSEADWPNRRYFPIGQVLFTQEQGAFRNRAQKHEVHTSLGNFPAQVTHCLKADPGDDCSSIPQERRQVGPGPHAVAAGRGEALASSEHKDACVQHLGAGGKFGETFLYPVAETVKPENPVMLVRATGELIPGHDLFSRDPKTKELTTRKFVGFLVKFVHDLMYEKAAQSVRTAEARRVAATSPP